MNGRRWKREKSCRPSDRVSGDRNSDQRTDLKMPRLHILFLLLAIGGFGVDTLIRLPTVEVPLKQPLQAYSGTPATYCEPFDFAIGSERSECLSVLPILASADEPSSFIEVRRMPLLRAGDNPARRGGNHIIWILHRKSNEALSVARVLGYLTLCSEAVLVTDSRRHRFCVVSAEMSCGRLNACIQSLDLKTAMAASLEELMKKSAKYPSWESSPDTFSCTTVSVPMHCGRVDRLSVVPEEGLEEFVIRINVISKTLAFSTDHVSSSQVAYNVDKRKWSEWTFEKSEPIVQIIK